MTKMVSKSYNEHESFHDHTLFLSTQKERRTYLFIVIHVFVQLSVGHIGHDQRSIHSKTAE